MDERVEALCEEVANLSNLLPDDVFALKLDENLSRGRSAPPAPY